MDKRISPPDAAGESKDRIALFQWVWNGNLHFFKMAEGIGFIIHLHRILQHALISQTQQGVPSSGFSRILLTDMLDLWYVLGGISHHSLFPIQLRR